MDNNSSSVNPNPTSLPLPPGCQFFPSEHQLITHYLTNKNNGDHPPSDLINDLDLYRFEPFDLPETARFVFGREGKRKHWYCFAPMPRVKRGRGEKRAAGGGVWRRSGSVKDIVGAGLQGVVLGTRKTFVFYLGDSAKTAVRTKWIMYEYALVDQKMAEASYVLCRVFAKSHHSNDKDKPEPFNELVKTVCNIGTQCDDMVNLMAFEGDFLELNDLLTPL
ncbi:NAC domain-containing protein 72-like [Bidens hawaiensis]|uniref:NAC domain-containing protein 72-like n=1 Tax=Bidens hawaiensis TaxID=980011 RepID=UPI0040496A2E